MNTASNVIELGQPTGQPNVVPLPRVKRVAKQGGLRFAIKSFVNRGGSQSWRVDGYKRTGERVRENFASEKEAIQRRLELETEYAAADTPSNLRKTNLTEDQIRYAELAFLRLPDPSSLPLAVDYWLMHGQQAAPKDCPRLDEAVTQFEKWLEGTDTLRERSKGFLRTQVGIFKNSVPNMKLSGITPDIVHGFLDGRKVSQQTKVNSRLAVSRFFNWCADHPRRWIATNPCTLVRMAHPSKETAPAILSVPECQTLMKEAEKFQKGSLVPYLTVCLFAGLRPTEAARLTNGQVNLTDKEIRIEAQGTKTKRPRVVKLDDTTLAWLQAYKGKPFHIANHRRHLDTLKRKAGFAGRVDEKNKKLKPWPQDVLRHTSISHYFRKVGSYGLCAEHFGNSENIIKNHYQGLVTTEEMQAFYAIMPKKKVKRSTK